jgi:class 3 adenylate cyclase
MLILPFLAILSIKYAPEFQKRKRQLTQQDSSVIDSVSGKIRQAIYTEEINDSLLNALTEVAESIDTTLSGKDTLIETTDEKGLDLNVSVDDTSKITKSFNHLVNFLLLSFLLGLVFNLPFKRYYSRKRKGRIISERLFKFCKRYLLYTPLINAGILSLAYGAMHVYMAWVLMTNQDFPNSFERNLFQSFFYISLIASILSILFVYFWEKHRVHIKYIEHIYSKEELRKRIFSLKVGKIRSRMITSAAMTTLLPLTIVMLYLLLSITHIPDLKIETFTEDQKQILFGEYTVFGDIFMRDKSINKIPDWLFYINSINSFFMFIGIYSGIFIAFIYIVFFVKWTTQDIIYPISELLANMRETGRGELNNFGIVRTNDELGELTEGYNDMTEKLGQYIGDISKMTEAYSRFVPKQFLEYLGKEKFTDIKLGDQVQKEMSVMFTDIRSFTEMSEKMSPKENFDFINHYLGFMSPVIGSNNGFIDKYVGDSIMALFSENPEDAINAGIEMRIKLSQFNQMMLQLGKPVINSGIGIHSGSLMLGVVGGEGRMDGTVISDAVNLASRLEGLTKIYGSSIIISQDTLIKINNPEKYNYRFLDIVKVKGKQDAVYIFEVLDGDPDDVKQLKLDTKQDFSDAIKLYKSKDFNEAVKLFTQIYEINKHDKAASVYVERCNKFIKHGVPDDWDGIETIKWN